jgi:hypothetical protein
MADRPRVIIALPNIAECGATADWLVAEGFEPVQRPNPRIAIEDMQAHNFDLLIADSALVFRDTLHTVGRRRNPMRPTIVVGDSSAATPCAAMGAQVMFVERPIQRVMLVCAVAEAVQDGRPVRRSGRKLVKPLTVMANGVPSHIIDVSNEGLRLALPPDRRWVPPPYFDVRIPLIGAGVTVQRMWTRPWPSTGRAEATWCGVALTQNGRLAEQVWRGLVNTIPVVGAPTFTSIEVR